MSIFSIQIPRHVLAKISAGAMITILFENIPQLVIRLLLLRSQDMLSTFGRIKLSVNIVALVVGLVEACLVAMMTKVVEEAANVNTMNRLPAQAAGAVPKDTIDVSVSRSGKKSGITSQVNSSTRSQAEEGFSNGVEEDEVANFYSSQPSVAPLVSTSAGSRPTFGRHDGRQGNEQRNVLEMSSPSPAFGNYPPSAFCPPVSSQRISPQQQ